MSISKKTLTLADIIRPKVSEPEIVGTEVIRNLDGYQESLENSGLDLETVTKVLDHEKRFITSASYIAGELAEEHFKENEELEALILNARVNDQHSHTIRVQKVHEPVEGKPQYGVLQVHSAFAMDTDTSDEFKKVSRAISKNIKAIAG